LSLGPVINGQSGGGTIECSCGIVAKRRAETAARQQAERAKKYLVELRAALGRLSDCTFDSFLADRDLAELAWNDERMSVGAQRKSLKQAIVTARVYAAKCEGWLYLYGPPGAGKSHLAAAIANDCATNGIPVAYASTPDLLAYVRRGMDDNSADARFVSLQQVEMLILDDMGSEKSSEWTVETLFRLIDERSKHNRATVITSNMHYDALATRIASRIAELATLVPLLISDYRRLAR
jgi:DNA replication protein DnaC